MEIKTNNMKKAIQITVLLLSFLFVSCEEVIDVNLNTGPKLVIEASINWLKGTSGMVQRIKLTTTTGYFKTVIPVVSNATIFITNSSISNLRLWR
jgi:hypothetical protein